MKRSITGILVILVAAILMLSGCSAWPFAGKILDEVYSNQSVTPTETDTAGDTGRLEIRVTDAPAKDEITGIIVKVKSIQIHKAGSDEPEQTSQSEATTEGTQEEEDDSGSTGGWITLELTDNEEFDLFQVKDEPKTLSLNFPEVGKYTQIRMAVESVRVYFAGSETPVEATVPSGKIKFIHPFEITAGGTTDLLFDFDAARSVNVKGNGGVMFKPVIKLTVIEKDDEEENPNPVVITTTELAQGMVNAPYEVSLSAEGGNPEYSWYFADDSGLLPPGLVMDIATGVISGTPTEAGIFDFTVLVKDSSEEPLSDTQDLRIVVLPLELQITTTSLPSGVKDEEYPAEVYLLAVGGFGDYCWSIENGNLPPGMALDGVTGLISGTPTETGDFTFTVKVTDEWDPEVNTDTVELSISISEAETAS